MCLRFEREQGYFIGAMYVAFFLAAPVVAVSAAVIWLLTGWSARAVVLAAGGVLLLLMPAIFRYSRVIWMHLDRAIDPPRE